MVVGLPLAAVGAPSLLLQKGHHGQPNEPDALDRELVRQLRENLAGMRGPKAGEFARRVASTLRIAKVHLAARGIDAEFDRQVRALIAREGKTAFLAQDANTRELDAQMKAWGFPAPRKTFTDYAMRERAVNVILTEGLSAQFEKMAGVFEHVGDRLDRYPLVPAAYEHDVCSDVALGRAVIDTFAALACLVHIILCAFFGGMAIGLELALAYYGC